MEARLCTAIVDTELIARVTLIRERIARVVENDVEYYEQVQMMRRIHQLPQFVVGEQRILRESRFRGDEVVNAITVVGIRIKLKVLQNRAEPNGARSQLLDVRKLVLDARELSTLKSRKVGVVERF